MRQLKLNKSGIIIPVMSLGTWAFGGDAIWGKLSFQPNAD